MEQPTPWLSRASFNNRITLPGSFDIDLFTPYLVDLEESQLPVLLGTAQLAGLIEWVRANPMGKYEPDEEAPIDPVAIAWQSLYKKVVPFLVYAAYAEYVFSGDVQPTDTGAVSKNRDSSTPLSDTQRTQLYRSYRDKANNRAAQLQVFVQQLTQADCRTGTAGLGTVFSSSRGRTRSISDSL